MGKEATKMADKKTFSEVYADSSALQSDFEAKGFNDLGFPSDYPWAVFYALIYGRHGHATVISPDEKLDAWQYRFCSIIWQFGPYWLKEVSIQQSLRDLSEEDLLKGSLMVSSNALNPAEKPSATFEALDVPKVETIQQQATSQSRRSKMDAYATLSALLRTDVTENYLRRFDALFKNIYSNDCDCGEANEDE